MKNKQKRDRGGILSAVLLVGIALALLVLLSEAVYMYREFRREDESSFSVGRGLYAIEENRFGGMICSYQTEALGVGQRKGLDAEALAVAEYADAAFQYRTWQFLGRADAAEEQLNRMSEAEGRMGIYADKAAVIRETLGLGS